MLSEFIQRLQRLTRQQQAVAAALLALVAAGSVYGLSQIGGFLVVATSNRFIEQDDLRARCKRARKLYPLLKSIRKIPRSVVKFVR